MMLGSLALVGLKVTPPNMTRTANRYMSQQKMMDLEVLGDLGLDKADQKELKELKNTQVEFSYLTDVTVKGKKGAVRLFSKPSEISLFRLTSGRLPQKENEIALASHWAKRYKIGESISFEEKSGAPSILTKHQFTIVGFVNSSDLWSEKDLGTATSGSGSLTAYGVVSKDIFDTEVYSLARLRFKDLEKVDPFTSTYQKRLEDHQQDLEKQLKDNGEQRYQRLKAVASQEIQKGEKELVSAKSKIGTAKEEILHAQSQLKQERASLEKLSGLLPPKLLVKSRAQLDQAQEQVDQRVADLKNGERELSKKEEELDQAKLDLEKLVQPSYHIYDRKTMPGGQGYLMYSNASASIAAVGNIFPVVLYAVAAMVTFTTMTRFVDEERGNAGIFKALGYRTNDILAKFVIYGFVAGTLGTIIGTLLGHYYLSGVMSKIITQGMVVGKSKTYFYWNYSLLALGLSLISSVLPAYLVARKELKEEASVLLLPKPPVSGSKILLENLRFIWKRLSFTQKVTARNIFRYKQRMVMTIFGVAGSVALLFAGLGIQSSVSGVSGRQFDQIFKYEIILANKSNASPKEQKALKKRLHQSDIQDLEAIYIKAFEASYKGTRGKQTLTLMVTDRETFAPFVDLRSEDDHAKLTLTKGAVITSKLAQLAKVKVGDVLLLDGHKIKVAGIAENYVGHYIYMDNTTYQSVFGTIPSSNSYLLALKDSSKESIQSVSESLMGLAAVRGVTQNASLISLFNSVAQSLNNTMMILVVVSILLAIVILYNLTNINVAERIRELSTIKVLGFHNKEVTLYIYRETILLSMVGIATGLLGGFYLHRFLIAMVAPDSILFYPKVRLSVYFYPVLGVTTILALLGVFVNHHLRKVDMLEALKSVE
jgi:ABC superfamily ATP binding cassette transporter, membrane protein